MPEMVPSSPEVSERMSRVRNRDTDAELALRRELHRRGMRYRVNHRIEELGRTRPDIVFTRQQIAVFVDGCFWHRCPEHATFPNTNKQWWAEKLETNVQRDQEANRQLAELGWKVLRIWEHEDLAEAADRVQRIIESSDE